MTIEIDFNSDEALYLQVRNQIIHGIATKQLKEGDRLPSVRKMADEIGINMHTVNKAYNLLRQEGFVQTNRKGGTLICININNNFQEIEIMKEQMKGILSKGMCKGVSREDVLSIVNEFYYTHQGGSYDD